MTGVEIRRLRAWLDLTPAAFGDLVGACQSAVYRWEACGASEVRIEPGSLRLLRLLETHRAGPEQTARDTAAIIREGTLGRGPIFGLFCLLRATFVPGPSPSPSPVR